MATALIKWLNFQKTATCIGAVFLFFSLSSQAQGFQFSFESDPKASDYGQVTLTLPPELTDAIRSMESVQLKKLFRVYVGGQLPEDATIPAIAGKYKVDANLITFIPRFDPPPGIAYTALFELNKAYELISGNKSAGMPDRVQRTFEFPELKPISGTAIADIYPSGDTLPANLLRMYVYFEQPMGLANPHDHVWLLDKAGQQVNTPFVEITEGLWNAHRTRLTLFFHPGRVKRGVGPNMTMGSVLTPGSHYELAFDPSWKDALGRAIGNAESKTFVVSSVDRKIITPGAWQILVPAPGTTESMQVSWPQPLDHALAKRMIQVVWQDKDVPVIAKLFNAETQLKLIPSTPWKSGTYYLEINPLLEDLAGNTPFHLFDTETLEESDLEKRIPELIRIPFVIE